MRSIELGEFGARLLARSKFKFQWIDCTLRRRIMMGRLTVSMRSQKPITGDAGAVVSLTSYGSRIRHVHYTIQSIANGTIRPKRIILWIAYSDANLITPALRALQKRGLEIKLTEDYRSHKKYYPYSMAAETPSAELPLATADDDILYPSSWLDDLINAAATEPYPVVVAHRAHRMKVDHDVIRPYLSWEWASGTVEPSYANVATGCSGVLYPSEFISLVGKIWGTEFMDTAASADDLWLHSRGILLGIPTKQVSRVAPRIIEHHPGVDSLSDINVKGGNNDAVLSRIYTPELIAVIRADGG